METGKMKLALSAGALAMSMALAGCGGGGSSTSGAQPTPPGGNGGGEPPPALMSSTEQDVAGLPFTGSNAPSDYDAPDPGEFTVVAGSSATHGDVIFTCPRGGENWGLIYSY